MLSVKGKWALVTGASRGVGREISFGLGRLGCNLVLHSREAAHTQRLADEIQGLGVSVRTVAAELSDQNQVEAMLDKIEYLPIDIVYNNAAVSTGLFDDPWDVPADVFRKVFEVDTISVIRICGRLAPPMLSRGFGRIVNVTSGIRNQPKLSPYAVAKAALDKYVYDFAPTLEGTGVTMNLLDPGWLRTDLGGSSAPNDVSTVLPGGLVPALIDKPITGRWFNAQDYTGMSLDEAVSAAEQS